jgi:hypothetical protein
MHFEDIWNEAEKLSDNKTDLEFISSLKEEIDTLEKLTDPMERAESMGSVLFLLAALSKAYNINVAAALKNAITNRKIDIYE